MRGPGAFDTFNFIPMMIPLALVRLNRRIVHMNIETGDFLGERKRLMKNRNRLEKLEILGRILWFRDLRDLEIKISLIKFF